MSARGPSVASVVVASAACPGVVVQANARVWGSKELRPGAFRLAGIDLGGVTIRACSPNSGLPRLRRVGALGVQIRPACFRKALLTLDHPGERRHVRQRWVRLAD